MMSIVMMMLSSCPAAAAVPDNDGQYPLHLAIRNQNSTEVVRVVMDKFPAAASLPNKSGHSPLALGLQARLPEDKNTDLIPGRPVTDVLVPSAFYAVLKKTLIEEDRIATKENREQTRSILWRWHADHLLSPPNRPGLAPAPLSSTNVLEWQISDVSIWIKYVALLPRLDSLCDAEVRSLAGGQWPPCEIADAMSDSGVDGRWLLTIRDTSDLPDIVAANARSSDLIDAVRELWGLQRAMLAKSHAEEDAAAVFSEGTDTPQVDSATSVAPAHQSRSIVYESLLDTGIALVLECKRARAMAREQKHTSVHMLADIEPAAVKLPEPPSVFERLGNEALFTGTQRFRKRHAAKKRTDAHSRFAVRFDEPLDDEETKVDRTSVRRVQQRVREAAEVKFAAELDAAREQMRSLARDTTTAPGLGDALLERAIVIFLRCRLLDSRDPLPPYNLACCHALLATPDAIGASYWATCAWQLGISPMDFVSDEDLANIQTPAFQRIVAAAAEEQGRHNALCLRHNNNVSNELEQFRIMALDAQPRADSSKHCNADQLRQLSELGVLFSGAIAIDDTAVDFVSSAAMKIQAQVRGYLVRVAAARAAAELKGSTSTS